MKMFKIIDEHPNVISLEITCECNKKTFIEKIRYNGRRSAHQCSECKKYFNVTPNMRSISVVED